LVLQGQAFPQIEGEEIALKEGDLAHVPRWSAHQTQNHSQHNQRHRLAMIDFGHTCALIGNDDRDTRLKSGGKQPCS
jgi:gentisate 1,2-dioxygenase